MHKHRRSIKEGLLKIEEGCWNNLKNPTSQKVKKEIYWFFETQKSAIHSFESQKQKRKKKKFYIDIEFQWEKIFLWPHGEFLTTVNCIFSIFFFKYDMQKEHLALNFIMHCRQCVLKTSKMITKDFFRKNKSFETKSLPDRNRITKLVVFLFADKGDTLSY